MGVLNWIQTIGIQEIKQKTICAPVFPLYHSLTMKPYPTLASCLTLVWESYENNGDACVLCATEEQARNHGLFEVQRVQNVKIYLSPEAQQELKEGKIILN